MKTKNMVAILLISDDKVWITLTRERRLIELEAIERDKSPRETAVRAVRMQAGIKLSESAFTMFAEYLDPFGNVRMVYFYAVTKCVPLKKALWFKQEELPKIHTMLDLKWLVPIAMHWDHADLENVIMLKRKPA